MGSVSTYGTAPIVRPGAELSGWFVFRAHASVEDDNPRDWLGEWAYMSNGHLCLRQ